MYLRDKSNGDLVEVLDLAALIDPNKDTLQGRYHAGEEMQDPSGMVQELAEHFAPDYPSATVLVEALPRCWTDSHYKD